jgi:ABC-type uncharacterized transport system permease subunit
MDFLALTLAGILSAGAPLVLATLGETLTERAGVINLSLDGTILLAAMSAFALAFISGNPWLGLLGSIAVGMATASIVAFMGPVLGRSQLAVGFILTLLCKDLAYFLGHSYARQFGPELPLWSIPGVRDLPFIGQILGYQSPVVYLSLALTVFLWWWLFSTRAGLEVRSVGGSLFIGGEARMGTSARCGRSWLDCAGNRHIWRLASPACRSGRLSVCDVAGAWHLSTRVFSRFAGATISGSTLSCDDPDLAPG